MANIFISYAHVDPDRDLARQLSSTLEANGHVVFVDSKIRLGQEWAEQIERQLRSSAYFVVLLSSASVESDMVRREISLAYKLKKAKTLTILPVRLGFEGELPYEIGAYLDLIQYATWQPGQSFHSICKTILQAIQESTALAPQTEPAPQPAPEDPRFDPSELDRVKEELAIYVGPMARVILDRAAKKAANWQRLYEILAAEIPAGDDRKKFLAGRLRQST